jgi:hypothetical protein
MRTIQAIGAAVIVAAVGPFAVDEGQANSITRTVRSGQAARMAAYHSWDPASCQSLAADLNIVTKPTHGVLIPRVVPHRISVSRFGSVGHCYGKPIKALQIEYRSMPGFKGMDTFSLDVVFGFQGRHDTDNYTVTVE